jgi:hypothetical protein
VPSRKRSALFTCVATRYRVLGIATHLHDLTFIDGDDDAAGCGTNSAEGKKFRH